MLLKLSSGKSPEIIPFEVICAKARIFYFKISLTSFESKFVLSESKAKNPN